MKKITISLESNGKPVYFNFEDNHFFIYDDKKITMEAVDEAIIVKQTPAIIPQDYVLKRLKEMKLPEDAEYKSCKYDSDFGFTLWSDWTDRGNFWQNTGKRIFQYNANKTEISEKEYNGFNALSNELNNLLGLFHKDEYNGVRCSASVALRVVGIGKTVTPDSLKRARAKDENNPRFWLQDSVEWESKDGVKKQGFIKGFTDDGVSILLPAGEPCKVAYTELKKVDAVKCDYKKTLPQSIIDNFEIALGTAKLYRSDLKMIKIDSPYLSAKNYSEKKCANCPTCATFLAKEDYWGSEDGVFKCVQCGQKAYLIGEENNVGTFLLADKPARNQFCIDIARCCDNCALFEFSYGRQGKRSTGYCTFTNQTVVAHNVCRFWMPDNPTKFSKMISQQITNLNTGVADKGNYSSANEHRIEGEIEDMIYREEDHEKQKKVAIAMKGAYNVAYEEFRKKLMEKASTVPVDKF